MRKFARYITILTLFFTVYNAYAGDKELCSQSPYGGSVTLTVEPCPVTNNASFYRVFYTQTDGVKGEGCWISNDGVVMVIWETHPVAYYPASEFGSCDPDEALKSKLKAEGDML